MKNGVLFSAIIPVYNGKKYLEKALASIVGQTCSDYEIVIVNDGSPDNSDQVIRDFIKQNSRIKIIYIKQKNKGLGGARNTAIRNSSGAILSLLDQDDFWYPRKLEEIRVVFEQDKETMLVCHDEDVYEGGRIITTYHYGSKNPQLFRQLLYADNCLSPSAVSFRLSVVDKIGYFSEDVKKMHFVEDYDYWLRIAANDLKMHFIAKPLGGCGFHAQRCSTIDAEGMCRRLLNVLEYNYRKYSTKTWRDRLLMDKRRCETYFFLAVNLARAQKYAAASQTAAMLALTQPLFFPVLLIKLIRYSGSRLKYWVTRAC